MDRVHLFFVTTRKNANSLYTENYRKMNVISDTGIERCFIKTCYEVKSWLCFSLSENSEILGTFE